MFSKGSKGTPPRLLPSLNASREESMQEQVLLNAQKHLYHSEGWGSLILW